MRFRTVLGIAAALTVASASAGFWAGPLAAAGIAGAAVVAMAAAWRSEATRENVGPSFTPRLEREVAQGKRLALYDHDTGLLAQWYLTMRFAEECDRATRYESSFSLILLEADRTREEQEYQFLDWMRMNKRSTDLVGCLTAGRYLMLLPDTDRAGAEVALKRLLADITIAGSIAVFPHDGATPEELQSSAVLRLHGQSV